MRSLASGLVLLALWTCSVPAQAGETLGVYVGTYTGSGSQGIYRFEFDAETGAPSGLRLVGEAVNPSFLAFAPDGKHLYAVNEIDKYEGKPGGSVSAFAVDPSTGKLTLLNRQPSMGGSPCHLIVDKEGKNVLVANYGGGSVAVLPIGAGGKLEAPSSFIQHKGKVADLARQGGPRGHSVNLDASGKYAFVADLGLDKIFVYKFDPGTGTITPNDPPFAALEPRFGPRHFAFHPDGHHAYVINEINSTVTAWNYDPDHGTLSPIHSITTIPSGYQKSNAPADVQVHPSGAFLFGSNRGHDSIAVFAIDPASGRLTLVQHQTEGIKNPRNFAIDPTGKFLLVANQDANTVVVFKIDAGTGVLTPTGKSLDVPKPVCLKFLPRAK